MCIYEMNDLINYRVCVGGYFLANSTQPFSYTAKEVVCEHSSGHKYIIYGDMLIMHAKLKSTYAHNIQF